MAASQPHHPAPEQSGPLGPVTLPRRSLGWGLGFAITGLADAGLTFAEHGGGEGGVATTLLAIASIWLLLGLVSGVAMHTLLRLVFAGRVHDGLWERFRALWAAARAAAGTPADRVRMGQAVGGLLGAALLAAGSWFTLAWLVENRHGGGLIATTFLLVQAGMAAGCGLVGLLCGRAVSRSTHAGLARLGFARLMGGVAGFLAILVIVLAAVEHSTLADAEADVYALPLLALALSVPAVRRLRVRAAPGWLASGAALLAIVAVVVCSQVPGTRRALGVQAVTSRQLFGAVLRASDFDADAFPAFPTGADCAPFDSAINPLALEVPGNGIDEDCDGLDTARPVLALAPRHRLPVKVAPNAADAAGKAPVDKRPSLVLITVDSWRADHLGLYGHTRDLTPKLDARSKKGLVFERAYSADSGTGPSLWSVMAGKTPFQTTLEESDHFPPRLGEAEHTLAELLDQAGYQTEAVLCGGVFNDTDWNLRRGFDSFKSVCGKRKHTQAPLVTNQALSRLKTLVKLDRPFFLWVHYFDPHVPYYDHPDLELAAGAGDKHGRYEEEIAYIDTQLDRLLAKIPRGAFVVVGADHGENFGDHGRAPHARTLYREVTHVPMLAFGPGVRARRVSEPVALNDVYPTFLELAQVAIPEDCTMVSQARTLRGAAPALGRAVFQENSYSGPRRHVKAVVRGPYHMLYDLTLDLHELYDLTTDPAEVKNLWGTGVPEEAELAELLRQFARSAPIPAGLIE